MKRIESIFYPLVVGGKLSLRTILGLASGEALGEGPCAELSVLLLLVGEELGREG